MFHGRMLHFVHYPPDLSVYQSSISNDIEIWFCTVILEIVQNLIIENSRLKEYLRNWYFSQHKGSFGESFSKPVGVINKSFLKLVLFCLGS